MVMGVNLDGLTVHYVTVTHIVIYIIIDMCRWCVVVLQNQSKQPCDFAEPVITFRL